MKNQRFAVSDHTRPDILYLVHRMPYPPDKGDRIRAFQVLRHLARKAAVHVACLADEPVDAATLEGLRNACHRLAVVSLGTGGRWGRTLGSLVLGRTASEGAFSSSELRGVLRTWCRHIRFQACLVSASSMVPYLHLPELRTVPAVIDLVDVDSQKWLDYAEGSRGLKRWLYRLEGNRLRRLERDLPTWARAVTLVSDAEADLYRGFCAAGTVQVVRNGVDLEYFQPRDTAGEQGCVFVGALDYRPNVEGAVWFCREVWPAIYRAWPQTTLSLVGRRPAPAVRDLARVPGVRVVGQVPDVRPYVAGAAVVVVPLQLARGLQNKILEALAMGKATVVSPEARKGVDTPTGVPVLTASSPQEWIEAVNRLLAHSEERRGLGTAGRRFVEQNHRWERNLKPLEGLLGLEASAAEPVEPSSCPELARPGRRSPWPSFHREREKGAFHF